MTDHPPAGLGGRTVTETDQPAYSIHQNSNGRWTWHCHQCDDAKQGLDENTVAADAATHHDLWHTNGRQA